MAGNERVAAVTSLPHLEFNFQFLFVITGVLGTTISPYMFFWQASEETEEEREAHLIGKDGRPRINCRHRHVCHPGPLAIVYIQRL